MTAAAARKTSRRRVAPDRLRDLRAARKARRATTIRAAAKMTVRGAF
jgi:hypothetical protein